ncbi:MAG: hypothetical protein HY841_11595 [Bacteroidetes bacterium]|nr:hypothetical protein [Bacteroidota bacterium]
MKKISNTNQLDNFLQEKLKSPESKLPVVDWSEVEVLLSAEQKTISIGISKKQIFISSSVIVAVIGVFFIIKYISSFHEIKEETASPSGTTTTIHPYENSQTASVSVSPAITADTLSPADTAALTEKKFTADTAKQEKKQITEVQKATVKESKKNSKLSSLAPTIVDSENAPENILPPDTAGKNKSFEIKSEFSDSAKTSSPVKNGKPKKGKTKKNVTTDSVKVEPKTEILPAKPDSVK